MKKLIPVILSAAPMFAFAVSSLTEWFTSSGPIYTIVNALLPILSILAIVYFIWGVIQYITASGDAEKEKEGRGAIIYGLVGLVIIFGVWGFIGIILNTFTGSTSGGTALPSPKLGS